MEHISTIAIGRNSRDLLKKLGNKGQTYDEIIQDLVKFRRKKEQDSPDREVGSLQSNESRNSLVNSLSHDIRSQINKNLCDGNGCSRESTTEIEVNVGELGIIKLNLCEVCRPKFKQSINNENNKMISEGWRKG
jgi:hypothetical protein